MWLVLLCAIGPGCPTAATDLAMVGTLRDGPALDALRSINEFSVNQKPVDPAATVTLSVGKRLPANSHF